MTRTIQTTEEQILTLHTTQERIYIPARSVFIQTDFNYPEDAEGRETYPGFTFETFAYIPETHPQLVLITLVPEDFDLYPERLGFTGAMALHHISLRAASVFTNREYSKNAGFVRPGVAEFIEKGYGVNTGILKAVL